MYLCAKGFDFASFFYLGIEFCICSGGVVFFFLGDNMRQVQPETLPKNSNLPVYNISNLKITPHKTPNSGQFSYPLPNIVSFLF